jgi:hypothetical protein
MLLVAAKETIVGRVESSGEIVVVIGEGKGEEEEGMASGRRDRGEEEEEEMENSGMKEGEVGAGEDGMISDSGL